MTDFEAESLRKAARAVITSTYFQFLRGTPWGTSLKRRKYLASEDDIPITWLNQADIDWVTSLRGALALLVCEMVGPESLDGLDGFFDELTDSLLEEAGAVMELAWEDRGREIRARRRESTEERPNQAYEDFPIDIEAAVDDLIEAVRDSLPELPPDDSDIFGLFRRFRGPLTDRTLASQN